MHPSPLNYLRTLTIAFAVLLSTSVFASPVKAITNLETLSLNIKISIADNDYTSLTITTTTTILTTDQGPEMELNREKNPAFESLDHCAPSGSPCHATGCCSGLCYREAEDEYGICV
ncbi:uncharacterized protein RCO7_06508 [Rhynchosporium graminicola]|uniref:Uncharacterized protein n=1 Tax=Rhynchosporium graminicola TaxID=2792576 RepID=A0A1E1K9Y3_9HELO|nr:uncharacterized protein RCO7_06508 [Rhynchosporium commune]